MTPAHPLGYVDLVRQNANFRRLWIGNIISLLGDWFNTIALYTLVQELTGSPFALGAVFIAKMLPLGLASPLAGVLADRYNRRRLMIGTDLVRAVIVLGFLFIDEADEVGWLYVLTAAQVMVGAVFLPARSASVPNIVAPVNLLTANALMSATWSTLLAVGAALGGFVAAWLGVRAVFWIDSGTYLVSAIFLYRTVIPQVTEASEGGLFATAAAKIGEGWRHMRAHPRIGRIALAKMTWAIGGGALVYMLVLLGEALSPEATSVGIGVLFAARGLGTGAGPILARALFRDSDRWPALLGWCIVLAGVFYGAIGFVGWGYGVAALVVFAHAASGANWVLATVLLQQRTEDRFRGRVFSTEWLLVTVAESVATLIAALLLETGGLPSLRVGFVVFAGVQICCGVAWLLIVGPRERRDRATAPG